MPGLSARPPHELDPDGEPGREPPFRLALVPGVVPGKWVGIWRDRFPDVPIELVQVSVLDGGDVLRSNGADAALLRLPVDRDQLAAIPLYTEVPVVVVPRDHEITAFDEVTIADLADEVLLHPLDDLLAWDELPGIPAAERPATTQDAIELVAAGIGLLVVPQSLARLYHRKDLEYRPLLDGPGSQVALAWVEDRESDLVEELIGIVRGRTARSSRGRGTGAATTAAQAAPDAAAAKGAAATKGSGATKGTAAGTGSGADARRKPARRVPGDSRPRIPRGAGGTGKSGARKGKSGGRGGR